MGANVESLKITPTDLHLEFNIDLKSIPERLFDRFLGALFGSRDHGGAGISPATNVSATSTASDMTVVCSVVWDREIVAAALAAAKLESNVRLEV